jgi:uncharacterized protein (DUF302 family)
MRATNKWLALSCLFARSVDGTETGAEDPSWRIRPMQPIMQPDFLDRATCRSNEARLTPQELTSSNGPNRSSAVMIGIGVLAMAVDGLITIRSSFGPQETMMRLEAELQAKGLTVFARIDHAGGAAAVGLPLRPTDLLIFGNAKGGTPLMQQAQSIGIDLPLKALIWQDEKGTTWLSYNDPAFLAQRHGLGNQAKGVTASLTAALNALATKATTAE